MRSHTRLIMLALAAIAALAMISGSASASRGIIVEGETTIRSTSSGKLTFETEEFFRLFRIQCNATFTIVIAPLILKNAEARLGTIIEGATNECTDTTGSAASTRLLPPIDLYYNSFLGSLPSITGILAIARDIAFLTEAPGASVPSCLYKGNAGLLFVVRSGASREGRYLTERRVPLFSGGPEQCPPEAILKGTIAFPAHKVILQN